MLSRSTLLQLSLAGSLVAVLAGLAAYANWYPVPDAEERATGWRRIAWPFPRDAFPAGRAWRRDDTEVYVRPKLGFCGNCDTGVVEEAAVKAGMTTMIEDAVAKCRAGVTSAAEVLRVTTVR